MRIEKMKDMHMLLKTILRDRRKETGMIHEVIKSRTGNRSYRMVGLKILKSKLTHRDWTQDHE